MRNISLDCCTFVSPKLPIRIEEKAKLWVIIKDARFKRQTIRFTISEVENINLIGNTD